MLTRNVKREGSKTVRTTIICFVLALLAITGTTFLSSASAEISDYAYIKGDYSGIDKAAKSVFYVGIFDEQDQFIGSGSGFVLFNEHLFVTNQHVIEDASYLAIIDDDEEVYVLDQVIASDKLHDIAILYFPDGVKYTPLEYDTNFDRLMRGQSVLTIGSPKGYSGTVSDGIISAFPYSNNKDTRYIQITAPISHGSSGGCLLNEDLKVIGITSSGVDEGQNLNFAIPIGLVESLYKQWNKKDTVTLGSLKSWDTVGYGVHDAISGVGERPQGSSSQVGSSSAAATPAISGNDPGSSVVENIARLGLIWDDQKPIKPGYALTIDGEKIQWEQAVGDAVKIANRHGLEMAHFSNDVNKDGYALFNKKIVFCDSIPVEHGFYIRRNTQTTEIVQIDIEPLESENLTLIYQAANSYYNFFVSYLGNPTDPVEVYYKDEYLKEEYGNFDEAVKRLMNMGDEYKFVSAFFNNLHFYVVHYEGQETYRIYISLSSWG